MHYNKILNFHVAVEMQNNICKEIVTVREPFDTKLKESSESVTAKVVSEFKNEA